MARGAQSIGGCRLSDTTLRPAILVEPAADANVSTIGRSSAPSHAYRIGFLLGLALSGRRVRLVAKLSCNFAAYAAALDGYTPAIIASDELGATGALMARFSVLAVARASEIIGIICAGSSSP